MNKIFYLFVLMILISSCNTSSSSVDTYQQILDLEQSRESDANKWIDVYSALEKNSDKILLVTAAGKVKNTALIPLFVHIYNLHPGQELLQQLLFAVGQTGSDAAEDFLLDLPFDTFGENNQIQIIDALGHCGGTKSLSFFKEKLAVSSLKEVLLKNLAFLYRKKIGTSFFANDSSATSAYYFSYAGNYKHVPLMVSLLNSSQNNEKKHLLKKLSQLAEKDSTKFTRSLKADSLAREKILTTVTGILASRGDWKEKYYALKIVPAFNDSLISASTKRYFNSKNPHLKFAATKAYISTQNPYESTSVILSQLSNEKHNHIRGQLLKLLAKVNPQSAFRIIMQDLDKGSDLYKASLLDALAETGLKDASRTLKQFLNIPNDILVNQAFESLSRIKKLYKSDVIKLLESNSFSTVSLALDWSGSHKVSISNEKLFELYLRFNKIDAFEAQRSVLKYFSTITPNPDSTIKTFLWKNASHPVLQKDILGLFKVANWEDYNVSSYRAFLPDFLRSDSITSGDKSPLVLIKTTQGEIKIQLDFVKAPMTVTNFLHLSKNGFYNGLIFHRVIADFVIQGGDPLGSGWGGTDYLLPSEDNAQPFERGSLGIATSGFDTGSCQFFICQSEQPHLTGNYTHFGQVIEGMEIVDKILPGDKIINISEITQ